MEEKNENPSVLVSLPNLCGLYQKKLILSQFWRMEGQNPGVSRVISSLKAQGSFLASVSFFWQLLVIVGITLPVGASVWCLLPCYMASPTGGPCVQSSLSLLEYQ